MRKAVINVKCPYCGIEYTVERHLIKNDKGEWCLLPINEVEICKRCFRKRQPSIKAPGEIALDIIYLRGI